MSNSRHLFSTSARPCLATHRPMLRRPQVLAARLLWCGLLASPALCAPEPSASIAPAASAASSAAASTPGASQVGVALWPEEARVSLDLRRAPLSTLLDLLSAQSGVKFRLATIPDAEVSVSLQNAPLRQAVRDVLALHGFDLRAGSDAFWLVAAPAPASIATPPIISRPRSARPASQARVAAAGRGSQAWRWWTSAQAPPPGWAAPQADDELAHQSAPSASGVPGLAPFGVTVRLRPPAPILSRWKVGAQKFRAASPGVLPTVATSTATNAPQNTAAAGLGEGPIRWCARWPLFLRSVPPRCVLVIESERPASLYVNGARLLHGWAGRRSLDLSASLSPGANLLAIEWLPLSSPSELASTSATAPSTAARRAVEASPTIRYEWLVAS